MSNKNLLPNYYVLSSINCIINTTKNNHNHLEPSIAEWLSVCLACISFGVQNPGLVQSYTVQHYKQFFTASASTLVHLS